MKKLIALILLLIATACSTSSEYDQLINDRYHNRDIQNISLDDHAPATLKKAIQNTDVYFLVFETTGFHEGLVLGVEIEKQSKLISDAFVINHQETPDYGGVVDQGWFTKRYLNQSIYFKTKVVPWLSKNDDEIVAITGATITSSAVNSIMNQAKDYIQEIGE